MKTKVIVPIFALVAFLMCQLGVAQTQEPSVFVEEKGAPAPTPVLISEFQGKDKDKDKDKDKKQPEKKQPETDIFTRAPIMGNEFPTGFNPHMLGDSGTFFAQKVFVVTGTTTTTGTVTTYQIDRATGKKFNFQTKAFTNTTPFTQNRTALVPFASSAAGFKIAENESPRPVDRVFITGNYFGAIRSPETAGSNPTTIVQPIVTSTVMGAGGTDVNAAAISTVPGAPRVNANLYREVFGFEKTFLGGDASVELRVPIIQQTSNVNGFAAQNAGDLTLVGKYAFLNDRDTGNVFSAGLALTVPTGPGIDVPDGYLHSTLFQPWFGYIWNGDGFFLHAFHSIVVPTDSRDVTLLFNDVGLNYWLYRGNTDRLLSYVVPMVEVHVTTPLNHRTVDAPIYVPDTVIMTGGMHLGIFRNATLSIGIATPVTGPRIFNVEAFGQLNYRY